MDESKRDTILRCDNVQCPSIRANNRNVGFGELGPAVGFSASEEFGVKTGTVAVPAWRIPAPFLHLVQHIVIVSPKPQVVKIATRWIVASVANQKFAGVKACFKKAGNSVSLVTPTIDAKYPVTLWVFTCRPLKATCFGWRGGDFLVEILLVFFRETWY